VSAAATSVESHPGETASAAPAPEVVNTIGEVDESDEFVMVTDDADSELRHRPHAGAEANGPTSD
jgi:hypothetical protein